MQRPPDDNESLLAEGQAALLLALVEAKLIDKERALDLVETVIASKRSMLIDGQHPRISAAAIGLLSGIANSITAAGDGPGEPPAHAGHDRRPRGR